MDFAHEPIFQLLSQYAYQPVIVYAGIFFMMMASGFGLPVPEELTIICVGLLTYMGAHPDLFPPPYEGAPTIHGVEAAAVTFVSVVFADCLVFAIGRFFGRKIMTHPRAARFFPKAVVERINSWLKKYGIMAAFIFRFTPGIRFPAHILLGMSNFSKYHFAMVDGFAALISVPSQILLIYYYGEPILNTMARFKMGFLIILAAVIVFFIAKKLYSNFIAPPSNPKGLFGTHEN